MNIPLNTCGQTEPPRSSGEENQFPDQIADRSNSPFHPSEENKVSGQLLSYINIFNSSFSSSLHTSVCDVIFFLHYSYDLGGKSDQQSLSCSHVNVLQFVTSDQLFGDQNYF